jgi:ribonucleoside-diphosphate reductase alpha chain
MTLALLSNPNQTTAKGIERQNLRSHAPNDREPHVTMRVQKRNGSSEPVDVNKIVRAVARCSVGLTHIDPLKIATKTIGGLYDGATTKELDTLSIQTAAQLIAEETEYSKLAARLLATFIDKEVANQDIRSFSQSIAAGLRAGLIADRTAAFVMANSRKLNDVIEAERNDLFEYFGLRTLYDRYLLRDPQSRQVIETPQYFFMRVACGLAENVGEALEFYSLLSSFEYMVSSPTLFNSGTRHPQMSSCYLLDSPRDNLEAIYGRYTDVAKLSNSPAASASPTIEYARAVRSSKAPTASPMASFPGSKRSTLRSRR